MTIRNIYKDYYKDFTASIPESHSRAKVLLSLYKDINDSEIKNILDIGAHDGSFVDQLPKNKNIYTVEASKALHSVLTKKGYRNKCFFWKDGEKLPYKNSTFDLVILGEFIEHVFDTDNVISEIKRVLRPGGRLLLSTPNIASLGRRLLLLLGKNPLLETRSISDNPEHHFTVAGHIRYFTFDTLTELLEINNFKIKKIQSDTVNFANTGLLNSSLLAKVFPRIGRSIVCLAEKTN